jgi:hypothetical protein
MTRTITQPDKAEPCRNPACRHAYAEHTGPAAGCGKQDCPCRAFDLRTIPPQWPCAHCHHPFSEHREENTGCSVELTVGRVPSFERGGVCPCSGYVYQPAPEPEPKEPETLDGPAMYAEALGYLRLARTATSPLVESEALAKAHVYFAGATAAALAEVVIDHGTDVTPAGRWTAAMLGQDLPEGP